MVSDRARGPEGVITSKKPHGNEDWQPKLQTTCNPISVFDISGIRTLHVRLTDFSMPDVTALWLVASLCRTTTHSLTSVAMLPKARLFRGVGSWVQISPTRFLRRRKKKSSRFGLPGTRFYGP